MAESHSFNPPVNPPNAQLRSDQWIGDPALRQTLKQRIAAEFREMPGLCLTLPQASRLFGLVDAICESMLTELVDERVIERVATHYRNMPVELTARRNATGRFQ